MRSQSCTRLYPRSITYHLSHRVIANCRSSSNCQQALRSLSVPVLIEIREIDWIRWANNSGQVLLQGYPQQLQAIINHRVTSVMWGIRLYLLLALNRSSIYTCAKEWCLRRSTWDSSPRLRNLKRMRTNRLTTSPLQLAAQQIKRTWNRLLQRRPNLKN